MKRAGGSLLLDKRTHCRDQRQRLESSTPDSRCTIWKVRVHPTFRHFAFQPDRWATCVLGCWTAKKRSKHSAGAERRATECACRLPLSGTQPRAARTIFDGHARRPMPEHGRPKRLEPHRCTPGLEESSTGDPHDTRRNSCSTAAAKTSTIAADESTLLVKLSSWSRGGPRIKVNDAIGSPSRQLPNW